MTPDFATGCDVFKVFVDEFSADAFAESAARTGEVGPGVFQEGQTSSAR